MKLKIFIPDGNEIFLDKALVPFLQPFYKNTLSFDERVSKYGDWIKKIEFVENLENCDLVMPAHYVNFYYANNRRRLLKFNKEATKYYKLTICWTNGDWGVTPKLNNYHLYRYGGYLSKNKGNQFCYPRFFGIDPLSSYYDNKLNIHFVKPLKPIIGFCGRASKNMLFILDDLLKNYGRFALKLLNLRQEDFESYYGSAYRRYRILGQLERSGLIETNFIRNEKYLGEEYAIKESTDVRSIFYQNMKESHYVICFRGWGNFSLRLYETLSAGRIPVIISSDNNLPFSQKINWNIFPIIQKQDMGVIAASILKFHNSLSTNDFISLQLQARKIWEDFIEYKGFMKKLVEGYLT